MKFYIATCLEQILRARKLAADLQQLGVEVVSTWHDEPIEQTNRSSEQLLSIDEQQDIMTRNLLGVLRCDLFVCIPDPRCRGTLVEYGAAVAGGKTIIGIMVDRRVVSTCMMSIWARILPDESGLFGYIAALRLNEEPKGSDR